MENLVREDLFENIYKNKKVLITGHTGFKGSWLAFWLNKLGAEVTGYALEPETNPSHYEILKPQINSIIGDILDKHKLEKAFDEAQPDIVFHLAAQAYVGYSYKDPHETYNTNVMGTLNVLEGARKCNDVKALVLITTDKIYENKEWVWGYRENDRLGGYDPYSASKACCEILIHSYINSFFNLGKYGNSHNTLIASARAGNVIGGGDWGKDRLIPDIVKNVAENKSTYIRRPDAVRPWQHVLESLSGYLRLGQKLLEKKKEFSGAWNFGPLQNKDLPVEVLVRIAKKYWPKIKFELNAIDDTPFHETSALRLDSSKAFKLLNWQPIWDGEEAIKRSIDWYKDYHENELITTENQLNEYIKEAVEKEIPWSK